MMPDEWCEDDKLEKTIVNAIIIAKEKAQKSTPTKANVTKLIRMKSAVERLKERIIAIDLDDAAMLPYTSVEATKESLDYIIVSLDRISLAISNLLH